MLPGDDWQYEDDGAMRAIADADRLLEYEDGADEELWDWTFRGRSLDDVEDDFGRREPSWLTDRRL